MQTGDHNHESLQPHPHADYNRDQPQYQQVRTQLLNPEKLRRDYVAQNQRPIVVGVRPVHAVPDHVALITIAAVPAKECFNHVAVADNQAKPA